MIFCVEFLANLVVTILVAVDASWVIAVAVIVCVSATALDSDGFAAAGGAVTADAAVPI
jgi:hypothetical protein